MKYLEMLLEHLLAFNGGKVEAQMRNYMGMIKRAFVLL